MPWSCRLYEEVPQPKNGMLEVPQKPGLGLKFNREILKRYGA
jgi:L-alanine-DL-glutamate epimerase-like enolase superfamily enzyme